MPYLDHAATSPVLPAAREAFLAALDANLGNASALHTAGQAAHQLVESARQEVAALIGADPSEIIFTSGSSEGNNTVIHTFAGQNILASAIEHDSILQAARHWGQLTELPVDKFGYVTPATATQLTQQHHPALVSVMTASNELGTLEPLADLVAATHAAGARFHTDATAAVGKIPLDVHALDLDYLTLSAHKIGGIIGVGALYVKAGAPLESLIYGGHQEHGRRAGTYATPLLAAFGAATREVRTQDYPTQYQERVRPLRDQLAQRILAEVPHASLNTNLTNSLPHLLNCSFAAAEGESIQLYLDLKANIAVSTGSACASGDGRPSHVLMATRHDAEVAHSSVRFSLGLETTEQDITTTVTALRDTVGYLQGISTIQTGEKHG